MEVGVLVRLHEDLELHAKAPAMVQERAVVVRDPPRAHVDILGRFDAGYTFDVAERGPTSGFPREILGRLEGQDGYAWWLSSHDHPRHVFSLGDGSARDARLFATLLLALPGPLILFQGEELGQPQAELSREQLRDPYDRMYWPRPMGRDGARTPMPRDDNRPRCVFSGAKPWLPVQHPGDGGVAQQEQNAHSVLHFDREALRLRRDYGLADGVMAVEDSPENTILARVSGAERTVMLTVNTGQDAWHLPEALRGGNPLLCSEGCPEGGTLPGRCAAWWPQARAPERDETTENAANTR